MKLSKKFFLGALAVAAFAFVSCDALLGGLKKEEEETTEALMKYNSLTGKIKIAQKNDTEGYLRNWVETKTKHEGGICQITINNQTAESRDGVMGYMFGLKPSSVDKTFWDFGIVAVRYYDGVAQYYVSYFKDVDPVTFSEGQSLGGTETQIVPTTGVYVDLPTIKADADGNVVVVVDVVMNEDGSYTVNVYDGDSIKGKKIKDGATSLGESTIPASLTGDTKNAQYLIAAYANVYTNATLTGEWKYVSMIKDAGVEE